MSGTDASHEDTPRGAGLLGAVRLLIIAALVIGALELVRRVTLEPIEMARQAERRRALDVVLPTHRYDNAPLDDAISVDAGALGPGLHRVLRARLDGAPSALVLEVTATGGYSGPIELLVAVDAQQRILAVRVTEHHETPGLGDGIDRHVDDWIDDFAGRFLGQPPADQWAVRKDGGRFDEFAGATVSPRAVVQAVRHCLEFTAQHAADLYAAPAGATLQR